MRTKPAVLDRFLIKHRSSYEVRCRGTRDHDSSTMSVSLGFHPIGQFNQRYGLPDADHGNCPTIDLIDEERWMRSARVPSTMPGISSKTINTG